jgi:hypothetical protein
VSNGADQDDLDQMLMASRELRERYRTASQDEPSGAVDDALRAQARRAVGARPRSAGSPFGASWRVPLSIAAVLVVSATLTVMVVREDRHLPSADRMPDSKSAPAVTPQDAPASAPPAKPLADSAEKAPAPLEAQRYKLKQAPRADQYRESDAAKSQASAPKDQMAPPELEKRPQPFSATPAAPPAAAPAEAPAPTMQQKAEPSAPPPSPPSAAGAASESGRDSAATDSEPAVSARGLAQPQAEMKSSRSNAANMQGSMRENGSRAREERAAPLRKSAPAAAAEQSSAASSPAPWESDPHTWLRHIETLVRDHRLTEARDGLKAFRQRYPSYPLPADFPLREP